MTTKNLEVAAIEYTKAYFALVHAHELGEKVRGLDEFDPKHMAWENRVYRAEKRRDKAVDNLKIASIEFSAKKTRIVIPQDISDFIKVMKK